MQINKRGPIDYANLFFCVTIVYASLIYLYNQTVVAYIGNPFNLASLLKYGLYFLLFFKVAPYLHGKISAKDLVVCFILVMAFLATQLNTYYYAPHVQTVFLDMLYKGLPCYLCAKLVHNSPRLNRYLRISACILLLEVTAKMFILQPGSMAEQYSQYDGFLMLTAMTLQFVPLVSEHRWYDFVLAGVLLLITLLTGARGPFLIGVVLLAFSIYLLSRRSKHALVLYGVIAVFALVILLNLQKIFTLISTWFGASGSVRTINGLLEKGIVQMILSNSRIQLFLRAWEFIQNHLFIGCGVVNERMILYNLVPGLPGDAIGDYPHNLFLEFGMQFGLVLGSILSILLVWLIFRKYRQCKTEQGKLLLISLLFSGMVPLMISGSYLQWRMFFVLLGFITRSDAFEEE